MMQKNIILTGVGGQGTVLASKLIAAAAMAKGLPVMSAETIGMAQKGGAVISDIKITHVPFQGSNKISDGRADLYLGFDILNATDPKNLDKCGPNRTIAVVSTTQTPTGQMVSNRHNFFPNTKSLTAGIDRVTRKEDNVFLDGQAMAEGLDQIFLDAGAEWREAGCSMCLGMNPDQLAPGERSASTSNRNFEGRQGKGGRTHLVSPAVAAATAVTGHLSAPSDL